MFKGIDPVYQNDLLGSKKVISISVAVILVQIKVMKTILKNIVTREKCLILIKIKIKLKK